MRLKVLLVAAIFAISFMGFYSPAQAADGINPYANVFVWAAYTTKSKEIAGLKSDTDFDLNHALPGQTAIGVKGEKGDLSVQIEYGVYQSTLRSRHAYARYKFGEAYLLFGRTISPYINANVNDVCDGSIMASAGTSFDNWQEQIRIGAFGAYFQLMRPVVAANYPTMGTTNNPSAVQCDVIIPKVAAGYEFKTDVMSVAVNGVYQQLKNDQKVNTATPNNLDGKSVTSYLLNATFKGNFGPAMINVHGFIGQNTGNMGFFSANGYTDGNQPGGSNMVQIKAGNAGYQNTKVMGGNAGFSFKIGTAAQFNAGVGYEADKNDLYVNASGKKDDFIIGFVNCAINVAPGVQITPEFKYVDLRKKVTTGKKEGTVMYEGIAFRASL